MDDELSPQAAASATALSARWYVDAAMADIDRRAILDRSWQLIAHASQLRDAGDHVVADLGGLPVIAVRGAEWPIGLDDDLSVLLRDGDGHPHTVQATVGGGAPTRLVARHALRASGEVLNPAHFKAHLESRYLG